MRITNSTLTTNFLRNLNRNLKAMSKYQNQLSSGKEVSKPSDDPILVAKVMDLNNKIMQNKQYNTNIKDSQGWVATQDTALADATASLNRIRDLVLYGANGTLSETDRGAILEEVKQEIQQLRDVLNTNYDGRYIFAGQKTTTRPFEIKDTDGDYLLGYNGDENDLSREISTNVTIKLVTSGKNLMEVDSGVSVEENKKLGNLLQNIVNALDKADEESLNKLSGDFLGDLDAHIDNVVRVRTRIGAIDNRLQAAYDRNISENLNLTTLRSEREDIDIAEKYMEYSNMRAVYQASLSVGSMILQPSLLDYLR